MVALGVKNECVFARYPSRVRNRKCLVSTSRYWPRVSVSDGRWGRRTAGVVLGVSATLWAIYRRRRPPQDCAHIRSAWGVEWGVDIVL
jgi:hypothetical protein